MLGVLGVSVVLKNDLIEQVGEPLVGVEGSGVDTDFRVEILATRKDAGLKGNSVRVRLVLILVPDSLGAVLAHKGGGSSGEPGALDKIIWGLEVGSALGVSPARILSTKVVAACLAQIAKNVETHL